MSCFLDLLFILLFFFFPFLRNVYSSSCVFMTCSVIVCVLCRNYEQIVQAHQNHPQQGSEQVSDQVKFSVFQNIMDSLFQSFITSVSVSSFQELSACVFSWIEEHCKPQVTHPDTHACSRGHIIDLEC